MDRKGGFAHLLGFAPKRAPRSVAEASQRRHRAHASRLGAGAVCQPCATFRGVWHTRISPQDMGDKHLMSLTPGLCASVPRHGTREGGRWQAVPTGSVARRQPGTVTVPSRHPRPFLCKAQEGQARAVFRPPPAAVNRSVPATTPDRGTPGCPPAAAVAAPRPGQAAAAAPTSRFAP